VKNETLIKYILWLFSVIFVALEFVALGIDSHYKFDFIFVMALLWSLYLGREKLHLHWLHYLSFAFFLLLHDIGMFRLYELFILGIEYDYIIHFIFGYISSLIIFRFYSLNAYPNVYLTTILLVLGLSAVHELYEFAGALVLGEGEGVLFIGAGDLDQWDTQKDMANNLIGGIVAVAYHLITRKK